MANRVSRTRGVGPRNAAPATIGGPTPTDAAERKRLRDRVAQQNLRNKRNRYIQVLEQQVQMCQELHRTGTADGVPGGRDPDDVKMINELRAENAALRDRQKQLQALFASFKEVFEPVSSSRTDAVPEAVTTTAKEALTSIQASSTTFAPITASTDDNETPRQASPPPQPPSPPLQTSPVSSTSTVELVMSASVPYQLVNNNRAVADTLPDYSMWLAGITTGSSSTDGESETEMNHQHHCTMDDMSMQSIHYHTTPAGYLQDLTAGTPSFFDTPHPQMTADASDIWSVSRLTTPQYLKTATGLMPLQLPAAPPMHTPANFTPYGPAIVEQPMSTSLCEWHPPPPQPPPRIPDDSASTASVDEIPIWARIPVRTSGPNDVRRLAWDTNVRIIFDSPDVPSPLDLMFGSKTNPLAQSIQRSCKKYYLGHAVRLAVGWQVYQYIKWRTQPTATRYALLPHFLKLTHEQIWMPHPGSLDLIVWEPLRRKMIRDYNKYDVVKFIQQYTRCLRLRWAVDEDVLETNDQGVHVLRPAFVDKFMSESGWGLKPEFRTYYPELFEDDEWDKIVYDPRPKAIN
ncbi:hypothetical protein SEUCBS139899_007770 [Sporothrix eucalyptigena]|uniref:BZIP domain-containing protein n=1 Tax=Sporothrix eucalyptigena TaxID=1812306 RepID=A0ABP0B2P8_9PEZI